MSDFYQFIHTLGLDEMTSVPGLKPDNVVRFGRNQRYWAWYSNDRTFGTVGDWKEGWKKNWFADSTNNSRKFIPSKINKPLEQEKQKRENEYLIVGADAEKIWRSLSPATSDHPYFLNKMVKTVDGIKQKENELVIPVHTVQGDKTQSLQFIDSQGNKRFLKGGKISGGCFMIGKIHPQKPIHICEGLATGISLTYFGAAFVVVAFNAGNLLPVAKQIKESLPDIEIKICGDDDWCKSPNTGKEKAILTASEVNAKVIFPLFPEPKNLNWSDFNDLWRIKNASQ
jgi:putative DNA primase/helicase